VLEQGDAEPVEKCGLSSIGLRDAAQADLTVAGGRQHDIMGLNACELFEHSAWRVTEACPALPCLPSTKAKNSNQ
jgi:hypothetical protein